MPGRGGMKQAPSHATNVLSTHEVIYPKADSEQSYIRAVASATEEGMGATNPAGGSEKLH